MNKLNKLAFTLIELLVVIAIIGILSGLIIVSMSGVISEATIAKAQVFSNSLRNALMANLVSEWRLDETTASNGTTITDSWGGTTGSLVTDNGAAEKISSDCVSGRCISLDGTGDYINTGSNTAIGYNSFTFAFWSKTAASTANQAAVYRAAAGVTGWRGAFFVPTGAGVAGLFYITDGTNHDIYRYLSPAGSNSNITDNKWHYIVGSCDRTQAKHPDVYLDGVLTNGSYGAGNCNQLEENIPSGIFYIGYLGGVSFNGSIDEVRVYNTVVPGFQIREQYYAGLNSLLISGGITKEEYSSRLIELAQLR